MSDVRSRRLALIAMVALVAGCSGGAGPAAAPPAPARSSAPQPSSAHKVTVSIEFTTGAPSSKAAVRSRGRRRPDYISPATLGAVVTATSTDQPANDATYGYDISLNNPNCSNDALGGTVTCTLSIPLAIDTYSIELATYDQDDSGLPGALGTELSTDTESETVSATPTADVFIFDPHAFVAGFAFYYFPQSSEGSESVAHRVATVRRPQALESPVAAVIQGAEGGFSTSFTNYAAALDRDGYAIDTYPGVTTFANGTFTVNVAEPGDTTGCTAAAPCTYVVNSLGTSYGPEVPAPTPSPATIPQPVPSDEVLSIDYSGGGSYGAGVVNWPTPMPSTSPSVAPTGSRPYSADISVPDPSGGAIAPYIVPHTYVAPLFAYASMGAGTPFVGPATDSENVYVWAAQSLIPSGASSDGSSYSATFSSGTGACTDGSGDTVADVVGSSYYAGYGTVFTIETTEYEGRGAPVQCTLTVGDGVGDTENVSIPVATSDVIPTNPRHSAALHPRAGR